MSDDYEVGEVMGDDDVGYFVGNWRPIAEEAVLRDGDRLRESGYVIRRRDPHGDTP